LVLGHTYPPVVARSSNERKHANQCAIFPAAGHGRCGVPRQAARQGYSEGRIITSEMPSQFLFLASGGGVSPRGMMPTNLGSRWNRFRR
jgi:hypothetical protein